MLRARERFIGVSEPTYDSVATAERLRIDRPEFIKWDARTGNAVLSEDGTVHWFDWEHAGARHPLDDVAWLLGDENLPALDPEAQARLLVAACRMLGSGSDQLPYLLLFGSLHMSVRLSLILLRKKGDGQWWNLEATLAYDRIGVVRERAIDLAERAARWGAAVNQASGLVELFRDVADHVRGL